MVYLTVLPIAGMRQCIILTRLPGDQLGWDALIDGVVQAVRLDQGDELFAGEQRELLPWLVDGGEPGREVGSYGGVVVSYDTNVSRYVYGTLLEGCEDAQGQEVGYGKDAVYLVLQQLLDVQLDVSIAEVEDGPGPHPDN